MPVTLEGRDGDLARIVEAAYRRAEPEHKTFRNKAEEFYKLYRGFTDFRDWASTARDADQIVRNGPGDLHRIGAAEGRLLR
jgi:hypothetical protein